MSVSSVILDLRARKKRPSFKALDPANRVTFIMKKHKLCNLWPRTEEAAGAKNKKACLFPLLVVGYIVNLVRPVAHMKSWKIFFRSCYLFFCKNSNTTYCSSSKRCLPASRGPLPLLPPPPHPATTTCGLCSRSLPWYNFLHFLPFLFCPPQW